MYLYWTLHLLHVSIARLERSGEKLNNYNGVVIFGTFYNICIFHLKMQGGKQTRDIKTKPLIDWFIYNFWDE